MNRGALVGHHRRVGDSVTLQPGAKVAGLGAVGNQTYLGMGAAVVDRVNVGRGCFVTAGALVIEDLPDRVQAMGAPARIVRRDIEPR